MPGILKAIQKDDEELREGSLQALEALLLRCPTEITPYLSSIIQAGNQFIKYDPVCIIPRELSPFDLLYRTMLAETTKTKKWRTLMKMTMTMTQTSKTHSFF